MEYRDLLARIRAFRDECDRAQLHSPKDRPMVYILSNDSEAYVGQTTSVIRCMAQHGANGAKQIFDTANGIYSDEANMSVVTDCESRLIQLMHADGVFTLTNKSPRPLASSAMGMRRSLTGLTDRPKCLSSSMIHCRPSVFRVSVKRSCATVWGRNLSILFAWAARCAFAAALPIWIISPTSCGKGNPNARRFRAMTRLCMSPSPISTRLSSNACPSMSWRAWLPDMHGNGPRTQKACRHV